MQQLQFDFESIDISKLSLNFEDLINKHRNFGLKDSRSERNSILETYKRYAKDVENNDIIDKEFVYYIPTRKRVFNSAYGYGSYYGLPINISRFYCFQLQETAPYIGRLKLGLGYIEAICVKYTKTSFQMTILGCINKENRVSELIDTAENDIARFEYTSYFDISKNKITINNDKSRAKVTLINCDDSKLAGRTFDLTQNISQDQRSEIFDLTIFEYMLNQFNLSQFVSGGASVPNYMKNMCVSFSSMLQSVFKDVEKRHFKKGFDNHVNNLLDKNIKPLFANLVGVRDLVGSIDAFRLYVNKRGSGITNQVYNPYNIANDIHSSLLALEKEQSKLGSIITFLDLDKRNYHFNGSYNKWMLGQTITTIRKLHEMAIEHKLTTGLQLSTLKNVALNVLKLAEIYYTFYNNDLKNFTKFLSLPSTMGLVPGYYTQGHSHKNILESMHLNLINSYYSGGYDNVRKVLLTLKEMRDCGCLSQSKMMRFVNQLLGYEPVDPKAKPSSQVLSDLVRIWSMLKGNYSEDLKEVKYNDVNTITSLHDELSKTHVKLKHKPIALKNDAVYGKLNRFIEAYPVVFGKYKLVPPTSSTDMVVWGTEQRHCIGTYTNYLNNTGFCFLGVYDIEAGKWLGHMMLSKSGNVKDTWRVNQFYGHSNRSLPNDVHRQFSDLLINILSVKKDETYQLEDPEKEGEANQAGDKVLVGV